MPPRKKPTELAKLQGTGNKHPERLKNRGSSKDCIKLHANKPEFMNQDTSDAWDSVVPALEAIKILTVQDLPQLVEMFNHYDSYIVARNLLRQFDKDHFDDMVHADDTKLASIRKSYASQMSLHWNDFSRCSSRFGMTPSDRADLVIPEQTEEDPLAIVLGE